MSQGKDQPPIQVQIVVVQSTVTNSPVVANALAKGYITQTAVNRIVARAINYLRQGE